MNLFRWLRKASFEKKSSLPAGVRFRLLELTVEVRGRPADLAGVRSSA